MKIKNQPRNQVGEQQEVVPFCLDRMATAISTLIHEGVVYSSVPCMSWEHAMQLYNENMHMFMTQCQLQTSLNRSAPVFEPAPQQYRTSTKGFDNNEHLNEFWYNKQKVLKQLSKRKGNAISSTRKLQKSDEHKKLNKRLL